MSDWRDLNNDGELELWELDAAYDLLGDDTNNCEDEEEDDAVDALVSLGYDYGEALDMDDDELAEALEEEGLDPSDYDLW